MAEGRRSWSQTAARQPNPGVRLRLAFATVSVLLLGLYMMLFAAISSAQSETALGVSVVYDHESGLSGDCIAVKSGDTLMADVYIDHVRGLKAWELRLGLDSDMLELMEHDYSHFLISTSPAGAVFPSLLEAETPDRYFLGAANFRGAPDSGSGILVRLTLRALTPGLAAISIPTDPAHLAPIITDENGAASFAGPVSAALVAIDRECPAPGVPPRASPAPSGPKPSRTRTASPRRENTGAIVTPPPLLVLADAARAAPGQDAAASSDGGTGLDNVPEEEEWIDGADGSDTPDDLLDAGMSATGGDEPNQAAPRVEGAASSSSANSLALLFIALGTIAGSGGIAALILMVRRTRY